MHCTIICQALNMYFFSKHMHVIKTFPSLFKKSLTVLFLDHVHTIFWHILVYYQLIYLYCTKLAYKRTFAYIICNQKRETLVNVIEIHLFRKHYIVLCFIILFMYLSPKSSYHNLIARIAKKKNKKIKNKNQWHRGGVRGIFSVI